MKVEDSIKLQKEQLAGLKVVLNDQAYKALEEYCYETNRKVMADPDRDWTDIPTNGDMVRFVEEWKLEQLKPVKIRYIYRPFPLTQTNVQSMMTALRHCKLLGIISLTTSTVYAVQMTPEQIEECTYTLLTKEEFNTLYRPEWM